MTGVIEMAENKLTRAAFFNYLFKKSIEKAAQVGEELIDKASIVGITVNQGVVLCDLDEITSIPKKFTYANRDYYLWAWQQWFALTNANCPIDRFPLMVRQEHKEFFCPLCQKSWSFVGEDWKEIGVIGLEVKDGKVFLCLDTQSEM